MAIVAELVNSLAVDSRAQMPGQGRDDRIPKGPKRPERVLALVQAYLGCAAGPAATSIQVDPARAGRWDPCDPRVQTIWDICGQTAALLGYTRELAAEKG